MTQSVKGLATRPDSPDNLRSALDPVVKWSVCPACLLLVFSARCFMS